MRMVARATLSLKGLYGTRRKQLEFRKGIIKDLSLHWEVIRISKRTDPTVRSNVELADRPDTRLLPVHLSSARCIRFQGSPSAILPSKLSSNIKVVVVMRFT